MSSRSERLWPRLGAVSGFGYVVVLFAATATESETQVALAAEVLAMLLFLPFLGYLWSVLREAEGAGAWLSTTALAAGIAGLTVKLAGIAPGYVARDLAEGTPLHDTLVRLNDFAFVAAMLPLGVFAAAVAAVALKTGVLPRWLGGLAAVAAPALVVNGTFFDSEFGPAFLVFMLWVLLASAFLTLNRSARAERKGAAAATA